MKQFEKIFRFELKYYLKNKVFVGITLFLVLLIAVVMFFPRIMDAFKSDSGTDNAVSDSSVMLVKADASEQSEMLKEAFASAFADYEVCITEEDIDTIKDKVVSGEAECAFVINETDSYTYYVNNLSIYDTNTGIADEVLKSVYQMNAMINGGMTAEQAQDIMALQINGTTESLGVDQMQNYWYTYIMVFALYMVILLYGQMVATNVATEKSSRTMEVLITSARPVSMMFGKVIASCIAGLIQLFAVFGTAFLCFNLNKSYWEDNMIVKSIFDMPPSLLGFMLIFFVLGFFTYAFLYGAIGSTASKLEDINTSVMPVTMLFIIAFFVVIYSLGVGDVDNILMRVCSFVPFTSPMAMFTRIAMSNVMWYEIVISTAVLAGTVIGIGFVSAKIYRVGVLLYGTTPKIGSIIRAVRKS